MKERMLVNSLRKFVSEDTNYKIGILVGARRTGKTTILEQLKFYYPNAVLIDFRRNDALQAYHEFLKSDSQLLLLDEITQIKDYEDVARVIENEANNGNKKFKAIFTGSSITHLLELSYSILGAGRCKLFRLPLLTFTEYLYFSNKVSINSFDFDTLMSLYNPSPQDFIDYLQLKGLDIPGLSGLRFILDEAYLRDIYRDISVSNSNCVLTNSVLEITEEDVSALGNMIAYTLSEAYRYESLLSVKGSRELFQAKVGTYDARILDTMTVNMSRNHFSGIQSPQRRAKILKFLLMSNLAYVEFQYEARSTYTIAGLMNDIDKVSKKQDFADIIDNYNICLISPLLYTRLGAEILNKAGVDIGALYKRPLLGHIIENYIKGSYCNQQSYSVFHLYKVGGKRIINEPPEVGLYDDLNGVLAEISTTNKNSSEVNLEEHFKEQELIRVLSTKDINDNPEKNKLPYHRIPYLLLCVMIDAGMLNRLQPTYIERPSSKQEGILC